MSWKKKRARYGSLNSAQERIINKALHLWYIVVAGGCSDKCTLWELNDSVSSHNLHCKSVKMKYGRWQYNQLASVWQIDGILTNHIEATGLTGQSEVGHRFDSAFSLMIKSTPAWWLRCLECRWGDQNCGLFATFRATKTKLKPEKLQWNTPLCFRRRRRNWR